MSQPIVVLGVSADGLSSGLTSGRSSHAAGRLSRARATDHDEHGRDEQQVCVSNCAQKADVRPSTTRTAYYSLETTGGGARGLRGAEGTQRLPVELAHADLELLARIDRTRGGPSTFGETAIMCWPFQYLMSWSACSVETMSSVLIDDISDRCLHRMDPLCDWKRWQAARRVGGRRARRRRRAASGKRDAPSGKGWLSAANRPRASRPPIARRGGSWTAARRESAAAASPADHAAAARSRPCVAAAARPGRDAEEDDAQ